MLCDVPSPFNDDSRRSSVGESKRVRVRGISNNPEDDAAFVSFHAYHLLELKLFCSMAIIQFNSCAIQLLFKMTIIQTDMRKGPDMWTLLKLKCYGTFTYVRQYDVY